MHYFIYRNVIIRIKIRIIDRIYRNLQTQIIIDIIKQSILIFRMRYHQRFSFQVNVE